MKRLCLLICSFCLSGRTYAASCCVANASLPQLMTLPAQWQVSTTLAQGRVVGDVDTNGNAVFRGDKNRERTTRVGQDVAYRMKAYQLMAGYGWSKKTFQSAGGDTSNEGISDASVALAREAEFPNQSARLYTFYRHVFAMGRAQGLPTDLNAGRSLDSAGLVAVKYGHAFDAQLAPEIHRSGTGERNGTTLSPSWGGSIAMGGGYVPRRSKWRYGGMLTSRWESASKTRTQGTQQNTARSQVWDLSANIGRQIGAYDNVALNYSDQTVFGPARNTKLGRTVAVLWQTRW